MAIAVENKGDAGIGRLRLAVVPDASQESLAAFAAQAVEPESTIPTDDRPGYATLPELGYRHVFAPSHELKIAHLAISLLKRWLMGTLQGAVSHQHLEYYLDEFTFRFNGRRSSHRGPKPLNHNM